MKELMFKEIKLSMQPVAYILLSLSALVCIPNYPYYVTFFYTCLGIFFVFQLNRENRDIYYMMALPIRKRDIVRARFYLVVFIELLQIITCIPFSIIRDKFIPLNNQVGIEANVAFFGLSLIMLGIFNLVFVAEYYKTGYKIGIPFIKASIIIFFYIAIAEILLRVIPYLSKYCDSISKEDLIMQIPVLILGIVFYSIITVISYKKAVKCFEKLDL